jgi:uncharacterized protein
MYELGKINRLKILKEVEFGVYLVDDEENEILLPARQVPSRAQPGDFIEVLVYNDSEDRPIATLKKSKGTVGDVVCLEVVDVNSYGAFLDWGLEKDLFLPFKHQKKKIHLRVHDSIVVKIMHDTISDRLIASMRIMTPYSAESHNLKIGDSVTLQITEKHDCGFVVIIDSLYQGLLFSSDIFETLCIGDIRKGYIKNIRPDEKIDVSLRPVGVKAIQDDKQFILEKLGESSDGFLPFNSKTSAEELKETFNLSKKAFKKAIGGLYKARLITITDTGIKLNSPS